MDTYYIRITKLDWAKLGWNHYGTNEDLQSISTWKVVFLQYSFYLIFERKSTFSVY